MIAFIIIIIAAAAAAAVCGAAGMIANAPQQVSLQQLQQLIEIFGFDVVLVLDNPSLAHELAGVYRHVLPDTAEDAAAQQQQQQQQQQGHFLNAAATAAAVTPTPRVEVISLPKLEGTIAVSVSSLFF